MFGKGGKKTSESRLAVRYLDNEVLLSATHAWTYVTLPMVPYEFLSYAGREILCDQITLALSSLVTTSQESVDAHLRVATRPFDVIDWEKTLNDRVQRYGPAPGWPGYLDEMAAHLEMADYRKKEVFLGVCLGPRRGKGSPRVAGATTSELLDPLKKVTEFVEGISGVPDDQVPDAELAEWRHRAQDVRRTLAQSYLKANPASAEQVAWLIAEPFYREMDQPPTTVSSVQRWGRGSLQQLVEGVVTTGRRWVEVEQVGLNGEPISTYTVTLAISRFPDVLNFPDQEPWMHYAASFPFPVEFSTRMSVVPPMKVQKDVGKKLADAKDQAEHIAGSGTSVPLKVREQLETATLLEYTIDKDRRPWAYARHRIIVSGTTPEEVTSRAKTVIEQYRELGIDVAWPTGDQFDLFLEALPGDKPRGHAYYQRQDLAVVAGGMPTASSQCGDLPEGGKGWLGPYLGFTTSRVINPVFFSPHVAMAKNFPPGVAITGAPGGGKALSLDTPIPTPSGWTTMGEVRVGDEVFDEKGQVCRVTHVTPVMTEHDVFEVVFDDGSRILADADHRWVTSTRRTRIHNSREAKATRSPWGDEKVLSSLLEALRQADPEDVTSVKALVSAVPGGPSETAYRSAAESLRSDGLKPRVHQLGRRSWELWPTRELLSATYRRMSSPRNDQRSHSEPPQVRTTREIADTLRVGKEQRANHSIDVADALDLPEAELPIDPYLLGLWLADGTSVRAEMTTADEEVIEAFRLRGYTPTFRKHQPDGVAVTFGLPGGLQAELRRLGVLGNKHVPMAYLRSSRKQRLALLQGLMDGDGYVGADGNSVFAGTSAKLVSDVKELIDSLGHKSHWSEDRAVLVAADGSRKDCGPAYSVAFSTSEPVFLLPRKAARLPRETRATTRSRYIVDVRPVESVPVRCITVDSPSHLYLAGKAFIPTHNTFLAFTLAHQMAMQGVWTIYIDPKADAKPMAELQGLGSPRVFDLRDGNDGILDPFALGGSRSESNLLALETLRLLLGGNVSEEREEALWQAVEVVSAEPNPSLSKVVDWLSNSPHTSARNLGSVLRTTRDLPFARLCFSATGGAQLRPEDGLTVVTLLGLDLPPASMAPDDYSYENRLAVAVMYLLTRYARQLMLNMDKSHPKAICIDEAWAITSTPQGAKLIPEIARMGRSHNTALVLVSQNAGDLMQEAVTNSISTKFAFRSSIPGEIDDVLTLMGLPLDEGYQGVIRGLRNGECVMQDVDGRVSRVYVDAWNRDLFETFNTNPETRGKGTAGG